MKVLDRYLIRELMIPVIYSTIALVFLILIADLFDNLDQILRYEAPTDVVLRYYLALIPFSFVQIIPWATWLGTLFLLINLSFHSEITAMKAAGLTASAIVRPILFMGFIIGIITFLVSDRIVPKSSRLANELRDIYIDKEGTRPKKKCFRTSPTMQRATSFPISEVSRRLQKTVEGAVILWLDNEKTNNRQKMIARKGRWTGSVWEFEGVTEYQMDSRGRVLGEPKSYAKKAYPEIQYTPSELASSSESDFLSYRELKKWTEKLKENGVRVHSEVVDLQSRLAAPWQGLVMMMIAIPLLTRSANRKLIAFNVLLCVGLVFSFHVFGALGNALGKAGKLFPFVSAWAGNILFSVGALLNFEKANY